MATENSPPPQPRERRPSKFITPAQQAAQQAADLRLRGGRADSTASVGDDGGPLERGRTASYADKVLETKKNRLRTAQNALVDFESAPTGPKLVDQVRRERAQREKDLRVLERERQKIPSCEPGDALWTELLKVIKNAFPARMELPVLVCDMMAEKGAFSLSNVGNIEDLWKDKPKDVVLRWIHVPLGQGLLHSSIEDMYRHDWDRGRDFYHAGLSGFPYMEVDSVHFRDLDQLQHTRAVYRTLQGHERLAEALKKTCLEGDRNETLETDLTWREDYLGMGRDFWDLALADMPLQLSENLASQGPLRSQNFGLGELEESSIGYETDQFKSAKLMVAPFRCFHRTDGLLLTMSASSGVDQLDKDFSHNVAENLLARITNPNSSIIGSMMWSGVRDGAKDWYQQTPEWFMVYLVTEIAIAPQNAVGGRSAASVLSALQSTLTSLKRGRFASWKRGQTIDLVRRYLICMDDLKLLTLSYGRKLTFLKQLTKDLEVHKAEDEEGEPDEIHNPDSQSSMQRVEWATQVIEEEKRYAETMLEDITQSLNALFQLRTIEQNELAMITDAQNKALFLFTAVTIIFLPLSTVTSYYGMNLSDIRNTNLRTPYFWEICGSVLFAILAIIAFLVLRHRGLEWAKVSRYSWWPRYTSRGARRRWPWKTWRRHEQEPIGMMGVSRDFLRGPAPESHYV